MAKVKRRGNCYVTVEALYHLLGGKKAGYVPHTIRHEGDVHWYLVRKGGTFGQMCDMVIDPTASQFDEEPDYFQGRGRGFLTKKPSKRARKLMKKMLWQEN